MAAVLSQQTIPVIGFRPFLEGGDAGDAAGKARVAREIARACEEVGFFYLCDHGIPQAKIDAMFTASKRFFNQPEEIKLDPSLRITPERNRGYQPLKSRVYGNTGAPDLNEGFKYQRELPADDPDVLAGNRVQGLNRWPQNLPLEWRQPLIEYFNEVEALGHKLLAGFALALDLPETYFHAFYRKPLTQITLLHYPPQPSADPSDHYGIRPHTDETSFTILMQDETGSIVGGTFVAQSANDGYTLLFASSSTLTLAPAITTKLPYDPVKDFTPVSLVGDLPFLLLVHPSVQANNVQELLALAKARGPGVLNYSSFGNATTNHFFGEMLNSMGGVKITHVPYKGGAPALTALIAGEVQIMFDSTPASMPRVQAGAVKALGITSARRVSSYPQIPTIAEQGLPDLVGGAWFGVLGPGGMSEQIVNLLHKEIIDSLAAPEMRAEFAKNGVEMIGSTPREFAEFIRRETIKWGRIARDNNIRAE